MSSTAANGTATTGDGTTGTVKATPVDNSAHEAIASWFLGPKAENTQYLRDAVDFIVSDMQKSRQNYHPEDMLFVTSDVQASAPFQQSMTKLTNTLSSLSAYMAQHNIPFYSPRYQAHMLADLSMPAVLGYMLTMLYNPNNVAPEASPLTTLVEYEVGQDLCEMLGFKRQPADQNADQADGPYGWGHITCGGSIANLESMWVARNLKYYPFSLKNAMADGKPFNFIAPTLNVTLCDGTSKLFKDCTNWELLNLDPTTVLDLAPRLTAEYGMSPDYVQTVMADYIIQTVGKEAIDQQYGLKQSKYFVAATKHYSWPKATAITGIGSENMTEVHVDNHARLDINHLTSLLDDCLANQQPVYCCVCILGSTEHGAVDPLADLIALRTSYQKQGLSFVIHVDAAWGGYFASLLRDVPASAVRDVPIDTYVPQICLLPYTKTQLENLQYADTVTIDPHKSGYIPYPAGGLCYRDGRMRYLVTWTSPYIDFQEAGVQSMGTYGVEGSKPGAAPVGAWMSHEIIGLHKEGYGALIGESLFTGVKFYCYWATMEDDNMKTVPFNMLPAEMVSGATAADVETQKQFIRDRILAPTNADLIQDDEAMALVQQLGSDLMINAFAVNFKINGKLNTSVTEANALNAKIYEKVSVLNADDTVLDKDIWVMSTSLSQAAWGEALTNFKTRLGLQGDEDLFILVNVCMSPFPTEANFIQILANAFQTIADDIITSSSIPRNVIVPDYHTFIMQGTDQVYLVALPVFQMANFQEQVILSVTLPGDILQAYTAARAANPTAIYTLSTSTELTMSDLISQGSFTAIIDQGLPPSRDSITDPNASHFQTNVQVANVAAIKERSISASNLDSSYPTQMPFYLYGTPQQQHMDHILLCSPNVQLTADQVTLTLDSDSDISSPTFQQELAQGLIAVFTDVRENTMQPFDSDHQPTFFAAGAKFNVSIYRDNAKGVDVALSGTVLATGTITLGRSVFTDYDFVNRDLTTPASASGSITTAGSTSDQLRQFIEGDPFTNTQTIVSGAASPTTTTAPAGTTAAFVRRAVTKATPTTTAKAKTVVPASARATSVKKPSSAKVTSPAPTISRATSKKPHAIARTASTASSQGGPSSVPPAAYERDGVLIADRYGTGGKYDSHSRNLARRSAWKASWETAVGRRRG